MISNSSVFEMADSILQISLLTEFLFIICLVEVFIIIYSM